jgi:hypothetical protein
MWNFIKTIVGIWRSRNYRHEKAMTDADFLAIKHRAIKDRAAHQKGITTLYVYCPCAIIGYIEGHSEAHEIDEQCFFDREALINELDRLNQATE